MRQMYKHVLIFSVYQNSKTSLENFTNHQGLINILRLHKIPHKKLQGKYNHSPELSILVMANQREMVEDMCKKYNQESYLERENDNMTYLVYADGSKEYIGKFVPISAIEATTSHSYTYDKETETYWMAR